jgi:hypothetical protein
MLKTTCFFFLWYKKDLIHKRSHLVLNPVYWRFRSENQRTTVLAPLFADHRDYFTKCSYTWIFPLFYHQDLPWSGQFSTFLPLYWRTRNHGNKTDFLFPLLWRFRSPDAKAFGVIPFFSYSKNPREKRYFYTITPLVWNVKVPRYKLSMVLPVYLKYRDTADRVRVVFPFFAEHSLLKAKRVFAWGFPLFFHSYSEKSGHTYTMFPLLWHTRDGSLRRSVVFPVFWRTRGVFSKTDVLFPLLWRYKNPELQAFAFMPFFAKGTTKNTNRSKTFYAISPLYWNIKQPSKKFSFIFPIYWSNKEYSKEDTLRHTVLFPFYFSRSKTREYTYLRTIKTDSTTTRNRTVTRNKVLFPLYWNFNETYYRNDTLKQISRYRGLMPFYGKGRIFNVPGSSDKTFINISPLYWAIRSEKMVKRFLVPIWWYKNEGTARMGHNVIFPLFWHFRKSGYRENATVLFPLYWSINGVKQQVNTLLPLYFYRKNRRYGNSLLVATPLFYRVKKNTGTNTLLLPLMHIYKSSSNTAATLFPLFSAGKSTIKDHNHLVITPLFWHFKNQTKQYHLFLPVFHRVRYLRSMTTYTNLALYTLQA